MRDRVAARPDETDKQAVSFHFCRLRRPPFRRDGPEDVAENVRQLEAVEKGNMLCMINFIIQNRK